jgi:hypothetical protein
MVILLEVRRDGAPLFVGPERVVKGDGHRSSRVAKGGKAVERA